jgi:hypothetical protein
MGPTHSVQDRTLSSEFTCFAESTGETTETSAAQFWSHGKFTDSSFSALVQWTLE